MRRRPSDMRRRESRGHRLGTRLLRNGARRPRGRRSGDAMKRRPTARALEGALLAREIDMNSLGRDVMSTIRYGVRPGSVWRDSLLEVHFNLVIHHAHWENQNIP